MGDSSRKKAIQLGMSHGTAANRLRKMLLWRYVSEAGDNSCYRCGEWIESIDELSIEHKEPWLDSDDPVGRYFDLRNITFSHLKCNSGSGRKPNRGQQGAHGTITRYKYHSCRCDKCKKVNSEYSVRAKKGKQSDR